MAENTVKPTVTPFTPLANQMPLNPQFAPMKPYVNPFGPQKLYKGIGQVPWTPGSTAAGQQLATEVITKPTTAQSVATPNVPIDQQTQEQYNQTPTALGPSITTAAGDVFTPITNTFGQVIDYGTGALNSLDEYFEQQGLKSASATNAVIDGVLDPVPGLGIASTLINPQMEETPWGDDFNTGGGGLIGAAGDASYQNLVDLYFKDTGGLGPDGTVAEGFDNEDAKQYSIGYADGKYLYGGNQYDSFAEAQQAQDYDQGLTEFYTPGTLPGVNTPIAISEGLIPGSQVVSGNTNLLPQQVDLNNDGTMSASEISAYVEAWENLQAEAETDEANASLVADIDNVGYNPNNNAFVVGENQFDTLENANEFIADGENTAVAEAAGVGYNTVTNKYVVGGQSYETIGEAEEAKVEYDLDVANAESALYNENITYHPVHNTFIANDQIFQTVEEAQDHLNDEYNQNLVSNLDSISYDASTNTFSAEGQTFDTLGGAQEAVFDQINSDLATENGVTFNTATNKFVYNGVSYDQLGQATQALADHEAEIEAQNAAAAAAAAEAAKIQANKDAAQAEFDAYVQEQQNSGGSAYVGGTVVTDSSGNPVTSSDGTYVTSGGTWTNFSPPASNNNNSNNDSGGGDSGGGGGGTIVCTALREMGEMPDEIWYADEKYASNRVDDVTYSGYIHIFKHTIPAIRARHWFVFPVAKFIALRWANHMAYIESDGAVGKKSLTGAFLTTVGEAAMKLVGKVTGARYPRFNSEENNDTNS